MFNLFSKGFWLGIIAMAMAQVGMMFKTRDTDTKGADDAVGNLLLALAPAASTVADITKTDEGVVTKSLEAARDVIDGYLRAKTASALSSSSTAAGGERQDE